MRGEAREHRLRRRALAGNQVLLAAVAWLAVFGGTVQAEGQRATGQPRQQQARHGGQQARDRMPVYRAGVELVVLNVTVIDDDGEPVADLERDDFRLYEDDVEQLIALFATSADTPLDVALLLDVSGSIAQSAPTIREDAKAFLSALGPGDCVYLLPFRQVVGAGTWGAANNPHLAQTIEEIELNGGTALYDALSKGLENVDRSKYATMEEGLASSGETGYEGIFCGAPLPPPDPEIPGSVRRTALVILSDGGDAHSVATYADTLVDIWATTVPIFPVAIGQALPPKRRRIGNIGDRGAARYRQMYAYSKGLEKRLDQLAHITGGRLILGTGRRNVAESFEEVVRMLRSSYLIGYHPPAEEVSSPKASMAWHDIRLESSRRHLQLFVRPGYDRNRAGTQGAKKIVAAVPELIADGRAIEAIEQLNLALRLDGTYWPAYLQRARALIHLGRLEQAQTDLLRLLDLRPDASIARGLLADTAYHAGDFESAWYHLIRAHHGGIDVGPLLAELRSTQAPPEDLQEQLLAPRVFVDAGPTPAGLDQTALLEVLRSLRKEISASPDVGLTSWVVLANYSLLLEADEVRGTPRRLEGKLVIYSAPGEVAHRQDLEIPNLDDRHSVEASISVAFEKLRRWLLKKPRARRLSLGGAHDKVTYMRIRAVRADQSNLPHHGSWRGRAGAHSSALARISQRVVKRAGARAARTRRAPVRGRRRTGAVRRALGASATQSSQPLPLRPRSREPLRSAG
ncbi:MAG: VWA domain-containing protein [Acidobacteriota bacterium]